MPHEHIQQAMARTADHFMAHPEDALSTDSAAVAIVVDGLRCRAEGPNGAALISDMPQALGGTGSAPTPGWLLRAALANCDATVIAMRAAQLGITLTRLEVTVTSESDDRGMLGVGAPVSPGPLGMQIQVRIGAHNACAEQLRELVAWAEDHSPVNDAIRRAVVCTMQLEVEAAA